MPSASGRIHHRSPLGATPDSSGPWLEYGAWSSRQFDAPTMITSFKEPNSWLVLIGPPSFAAANRMTVPFPLRPFTYRSLIATETASKAAPQLQLQEMTLAPLA